MNSENHKEGLEERLDYSPEYLACLEAVAQRIARQRLGIPADGKLDDSAKSTKAEMDDDFKKAEEELSGYKRILIGEEQDSEARTLAEVVRELIGEKIFVKKVSGSESLMLALSSKEVYDLVFVSTTIPPIGGHAVAVEAKSDSLTGRHPIVLTGPNDVAQAVAALKVGRVLNYLTKPFEKGKLKESIKNIVEGAGTKRPEEPQIELNGQGITNFLARFGGITSEAKAIFPENYDRIRQELRAEKPVVLVVSSNEDTRAKGNDIKDALIRDGYKVHVMGPPQALAFLKRNNAHAILTDDIDADFHQKVKERTDRYNTQIVAFIVGRKPADVIKIKDLYSVHLRYSSEGIAGSLKGAVEACKDLNATDRAIMYTRAEGSRRRVEQARNDFSAQEKQVIYLIERIYDPSLSEDERRSAIGQLVAMRSANLEMQANTGDHLGRFQHDIYQIRIHRGSGNEKGIILKLSPVEPARSITQKDILEGRMLLPKEILERELKMFRLIGELNSIKEKEGIENYINVVRPIYPDLLVFNNFCLITSKYGGEPLDSELRVLYEFAQAGDKDSLMSLERIMQDIVVQEARLIANRSFFLREVNLDPHHIPDNALRKEAYNSRMVHKFIGEGDNPFRGSLRRQVSDEAMMNDVIEKYRRSFSAIIDLFLNARPGFYTDRTWANAVIMKNGGYSSPKLIDFGNIRDLPDQFGSPLHIGPFPYMPIILEKPLVFGGKQLYNAGDAIPIKEKLIVEGAELINSESAASGDPDHAIRISDIGAHLLETYAIGVYRAMMHFSNFVNWACGREKDRDNYQWYALHQLHNAQADCARIINSNPIAGSYVTDSQAVAKMSDWLSALDSLCSYFDKNQLVLK